jgi:hypothetical protein
MQYGVAAVLLTLVNTAVYPAFILAGSRNGQTLGLLMTKGWPAGSFRAGPTGLSSHVIARGVPTFFTVGTLWIASLEKSPSRGHIGLVTRWLFQELERRLLQSV